LKFGLEGVGTLPQLSVATQLDNKGRTSPFGVNMGRTLIGITREKMISLKNDGIIATVFSVTSKPNQDFELQEAEASKEVRLEPGHLWNMTTIFNPQKVRKSQFELIVAVKDNPKANIQFVFSGEGFSEDVIFEGLGEDDNELLFSNCIVGKQSQQSFAMRNVSQNDIRFCWQTHPDFGFVPRTGHLRIGKSKTILVSFMAEKPVKHSGVKIGCSWNKIELDDGNAPEWDDSMKIVKFVPRSSLIPEPVPVGSDDKSKKTRTIRGQKVPIVVPKKAAPTVTPPPAPVSPGPASQRDPDEIVRVTEIVPEPAYQLNPAKMKDLQLKINAISDSIRYQIDTTEISFAPTMMYQSRVVEVRVTNPSSIRFDYTWSADDFQALRTDYAITRKTPFSVRPVSGFIDPGQFTVFKVIFTPEEVDDFTGSLKMDIPYLFSMDPAVIVVTALSRRPLCHFNVEVSDYLSAGRRHPDYVDVLPEGIRVIEIFSPAVGVRKFKRFEVINPTSSPYEIVWVQRSEKNAIECETPNALVSSGKRYSVSFSYAPTSVKTVEMQFDFMIPSHAVTIPVLLVGRIMPR
jgi:hydrocephalus-inducing protein